MKHLRRVALNNSPQLTDRMLAHWVAHWPKLERLDLSNCAQLTAAPANLPRLTQLKLSGTQLTDASLSLLADQSPGITQLDLTHCPHITDVGLRALARLTNLSVVSLASCSGVSDVGIANLAKPGQLECLNLAGCRATDAGLLDVLEYSPKLRQLNLTGCSQLTGFCLQPLCWSEPACPEIESINLSDCSRLTDDQIKQLAEARPELQILGIRARRLLLSDLGKRRLNERSKTASSTNLDSLNTIKRIDGLGHKPTRLSLTSRGLPRPVSA